MCPRLLGLDWDWRTPTSLSTLSVLFLCTSFLKKKKIQKTKNQWGSSTMEKFHMKTYEFSTSLGGQKKKKYVNVRHPSPVAMCGLCGAGCPSEEAAPLSSQGGVLPATSHRALFSLAASPGLPGEVVPFHRSFAQQLSAEASVPLPP